MIQVEGGYWASVGMGGSGNQMNPYSTVVGGDKMVFCGAMDVCVLASQVQILYGCG